MNPSGAAVARADRYLPVAIVASLALHLALIALPVVRRPGIPVPPADEKRIVVSMRAPEPLIAPEPTHRATKPAQPAPHEVPRASAARAAPEPPNVSAADFTPLAEVPPIPEPLIPEPPPAAQALAPTSPAPAPTTPAPAPTTPVRIRVPGIGQSEKVASMAARRELPQSVPAAAVAAAILAAIPAAIPVDENPAFPAVSPVAAQMPVPAERQGQVKGQEQAPVVQPPRISSALGTRFPETAAAIPARGTAPQSAPAPSAGPDHGPAPSSSPGTEEPVPAPVQIATVPEAAALPEPRAAQPEPKPAPREEDILALLAAMVSERKSYPEAARKRNAQGQVRVTMAIAPDGSLTGLELEKKSGSAILDRAALDLVKSLFPLESGPIVPIRVGLAIEYRMAR